MFHRSYQVSLETSDASLIAGYQSAGTPDIYNFILTIYNKNRHNTTNSLAAPSLEGFTCN